MVNFNWRQIEAKEESLKHRIENLKRLNQEIQGMQTEYWESEIGQIILKIINETETKGEAIYNIVIEKNFNKKWNFPWYRSKILNWFFKKKGEFAIKIHKRPSQTSKGGDSKGRKKHFFIITGLPKMEKFYPTLAETINAEIVLESWGLPEQNFKYPLFQYLEKKYRQKYPWLNTQETADYLNANQNNYPNFKIDAENNIVFVKQKVLPNG